MAIDRNNSLYVCDHDNDRIQLWLSGAITGTTFAGTGAGSNATAVPHPAYNALDINGYLYVTTDQLDMVLRFAPNSPIGTIVAGTTTHGTALNQLDTPTDMVLDDNLNLYVIDSHNKRVMLWPPNATTGIPVITNLNSGKAVGIQLAPNSTNAVYLSVEDKHAIYLWNFNDTTYNLSLDQVNSTVHNTLNKPQGIIYDQYYNLYVADKDNDRVVRFCYNETVGYTVIGESSTSPIPTKAMDIAFDTNFNMYVVIDGDEVIKYALL